MKAANRRFLSDGFNICEGEISYLATAPSSRSCKVLIFSYQRSQGNLAERQIYLL
ncbi:MAG: hypothetical protein PHZ11_10475 [Desulfitobacteriaceae bacterium]|nr:hypothetical protein [Desulfitobacteriaceae bacterium]